MRITLIRPPEEPYALEQSTFCLFGNDADKATHTNTRGTSIYYLQASVVSWRVVRREQTYWAPIKSISCAERKLGRPRVNLQIVVKHEPCAERSLRERLGQRPPGQDAIRNTEVGLFADGLHHVSGLDAWRIGQEAVDRCRRGAQHISEPSLKRHRHRFMERIGREDRGRQLHDTRRRIRHCRPIARCSP